MDSLVQDVLNASMVFAGIELMNRPDARDKLESAAGTEVVGLDVGFSVADGGAPEPSRRLVLQRDRISLDLSSTRSSVAIEYPNRDFVQLAKVVDIALSNTDSGQQLGPYGYNMALVLNTGLDEPAVSFLGNSLFHTQLFQQPQWNRVGGYGTQIFTDGSRQWTFRVEPRPINDNNSRRLFMAINVHIDDAGRPTEEEIRRGFIEILSNAEQFVSQLLSTR